MPNEKLSKEELRYTLGLPMKIYGTLSYVSTTADGELVLYITKNNMFKLKEIAKTLKDIEGRETYITLDIGNWE